MNNQTSPSPQAMRAATIIAKNQHCFLNAGFIAPIIQTAIDEHDRETGVEELRAVLDEALTWWHSGTRRMNQQEPGWLKKARAALGKET
jgi:hypothetical protein